MKPFLILQLRPNDAAADGEFQAFLKYGGLTENDIHRVRMEKESIPKIKLDDYSGVIIGGGPSNVSDSEKKKSSEQKRFEDELAQLVNKIIEELEKKINKSKIVVRLEIVIHLKMSLIKFILKKHIKEQR